MDHFSSFTIFLLLSQCFGSIVMFSGMLDIEEINNVNYGIDILKEPVLLKPEVELPVNHIHLTSKYGQRYQCHFPDQVETERKIEEKEKEALETGIPELLKPLESVPCLLKAKDWWSYEFCYGKYIRQFHVEDGKILGDIVYLGYYDSEKDWSERGESYNKLNRYHSQSYVNGSKCDLTGDKRKTEVRFVCDEGSGDHIGRIDEPETCSYVMTIHTNKICHHPYLKPIKQSQAVPITCNPLLTEEQYTEYNQMVEEEIERKRKEEEKKMKQAEQKLHYTETGGDDVDEESFQVFDENGELKNINDVNWNTDTKSDSLTNSLKDAELKVKVQVINNLDDLEKVFKDLKKTENAGGKLTSDSMVNVNEKKSETDEDTNEKDTENTEKTTLTFEKSKPKDKSKSFVSEVVEEMDQTDKTEDMDDILDEDDTSLIEEFDKGLKDTKFTDLKTRLEKNKASLSDLQSQVKDAMEQELDGIIEEAEEEVGVNLEEKKKSYKHLTESLENLIKRLDNTQEEIDKVDKHIEEATDDLTALKEETDIKDKIQGPDSDERVKVRVTRVNKKELQKTDDKKQTSEIENVEIQIKDELEKAGLDLAGGKVQVKIITAGYYDKKGEPIKTLSADDSDAFKNMIVSILGGDQEAAQEANKYQEQEDNYSFVWQNKDKKTS
ncbi:uncharacterized protein LOC143064699 [Mytilus galloprovincialis]|uniref:uncharacterized protein LOC143064699 n=1 Tax=Mytilus galloprovincialis TaxID=29158 RepID=UPI003F7C0C84